MHRIGTSVVVKCDNNDLHKGIITAYLAGRNEDGEREYWMNVEGFSGSTIWPESAIVRAEVS